MIYNARQNSVEVLFVRFHNIIDTKKKMRYNIYYDKVLIRF